ncbi:hypothetical protein L226DRAFT_312117 [Lentinus tigrinus ALCF2SS1-7]|uniref:uncharacterized protein n=1 Tax=Lentinus tigrinus ALCF2SS1-7 TaxID=1328758 RepID=UPI0011663DB4|nr:hypothetical protein L226DRAFT_312117 [Lentinus tigrinus ALCF2SS1-7]
MEHCPLGTVDCGSCSGNGGASGRRTPEAQKRGFDRNIRRVRWSVACDIRIFRCSLEDARGSAVPGSRIRIWVRYVLRVRVRSTQTVSLSGRVDVWTGGRGSLLSALSVRREHPPFLSTRSPAQRASGRTLISRSTGDLMLKHTHRQSYALVLVWWH